MSSAYLPDPPYNLVAGSAVETYSFTVDSQPVLTPDEYIDGIFTVPTPDLVITCNGGAANLGCDGQPITMDEPSVSFFDAENEGAFQINVISSDITGPPPEAFSFIGPAMFTGDSSAPTIVPGTYSFFQADGYPLLQTPDGYYWPFTPSDVTITDISATPEPGTLALTLTGALGAGAALLRRRRLA